MRLIAQAIETFRAMPGLEAVYYLEDSEHRHVVSLLLFDTEAHLQDTDKHHEGMRDRARLAEVSLPAFQGAVWQPYAGCGGSVSRTSPMRRL